MTTLAPSTSLILGTMASLAVWTGLVVLLVRWTRPRRRGARTGANPE